MINACAIAARFAAALPEYETPEHTELREGFYHVRWLKGNENEAELAMYLRDFENEVNLRRIEYLRQLIKTFEIKYRGLKIDLEVRESYRNMREVLQHYPEVSAKAAQAIEMAGVRLIPKAIRGGTDGARMSFEGMPTPNIFMGGLLSHSKKEWIPDIALQKAAEVIVYLGELWAQTAI